TLTGLGSATASSGVASKTVAGGLVGALTLGAAASGLTDDAQSFVVVTGPADHLTFTSSAADLTSGLSRTLTAQVRDAAGNLATGYSGTAHVTSTDGQATLPSDYGFGAGDAGRHDFSVTLRSHGTQTVTVTDTGDATLTKTTGGITVSTDVASTATSTIVTADGTLTADGSSTTAVTVQLKDQFGNDIDVS